MVGCLCCGEVVGVWWCDFCGVVWLLGYGGEIIVVWCGYGRKDETEGEAKGMRQRKHLAGRVVEQHASCLQELRKQVFRLCGCNTCVTAIITKTITTPHPTTPAHNHVTPQYTPPHHPPFELPPTVLPQLYGCYSRPLWPADVQC